MKGKPSTLVTDDDASLNVGMLWKIALALLVIVVALAVLNWLFAFAIGLLHPLFVLVGLALIVLWLLDRV